MKIGLNGERLLIKNPAGAEKYSHHIFSAMAKVDTKNEYIVYFTKEPLKRYWDSLSRNNPNFSYKVIKKTLSWTQFDLALELIRNPVDVFFGAVHTMPVFRSPKTKFVGMIHGLEYTYSHGYKNPIKRFFLEGPVKYVVKHSNHIIVPSQATKDAIDEKGWENNISIVFEGFDETFNRKSEKEIRKVRDKYNIGNSPYLLFVSTIQPRKNIPNMVGGFSKVTEEHPDLKLLIAGKEGWDFDESINAPKRYGVENKVMFLGRIPDEDLPSLFSGAAGHINVSFEEGFGLPLLESLACETPSVVSNIPPYHEVGGDLPIYVDPNSIKAIENGILDLLKKKHNREKLRKRAELFSWSESAKKTISILESVFENL
jgi:glycosyltransferase involved in cell wall biosynthesis